MEYRDSRTGDVQWRNEGGPEPVLRFSGDWTLAHFAELEAKLNALKPQLPETPDVDFNDVARIDTAGAGLIAVGKSGGSHSACSALSG